MNAVLQLPVKDEEPSNSGRDRELSLEAQKMEAMGRLVGGVAHDFNNLLTGILLYSDLLIAGLRGDEILRGYAEEIRRAGSHSSALIQQLLSVAKPGPDGDRKSSWREIILGMQVLLIRLLGENIELLTDFAEDAGAVQMAAAPMRQILLNLLLNARDAMPGGGRIVLSTRKRALQNVPHEQLIVRDTGCGMDAETCSRMFEDFFSTKRPGQGNGVGLATVARIVKQANGAIEVDSAPGKGTTISVLLPCANALTPAAEISRPPLSPETEKRKS